MDPARDFPLTLRHLEGKAPRADTVDAFARAVCDEHARGDIPHRAARDLVHYEAIRAKLAPAAQAARAPGPFPDDDARLVLAPHVRLLMYGADLPAMLAALREGKPATPRASMGWLLLTAQGDQEVEREEGWFLSSFKTPVPLREAVGMHPRARSALQAWWEKGVLVRA